MSLKNGTQFSPMKIILLGASGVGKSQILNRLNGNDWNPSLASTIGVEFLGRVFTLPNGVKIKAQIWDTAGQEKFASMMSTYYRSSKGCVLVYDVLVPSSFDKMEVWRKKLMEHVDDTCKIVICANKIDMVDGGDEQYDMTRTIEYAKKTKCVGTFVTSAKSDLNITKAFTCLINAIAEVEQLSQDLSTRKSGLESHGDVVLATRTKSETQKTKRRFGFC